jgi:ABC-type transport system involved in multi-copper enzyme maturation permease subunit
MAQLTVFVAVVFFLLGKHSPEDRLAIVLGCSFGVVLIVPMGISRDKMEGTLDFICGLPLEPRDIAASRFGAVGLCTVPWAVVIGAVWLARPFSIALNPLAVFAVAWLAMLTVGAGATAIFTCFELESLFGVPIIAMLLLVVVLPRIAHALFPALTTAITIESLMRPASPSLAALAALLFVGLTGAIAFAATVRGLARHG